MEVTDWLALLSQPTHANSLRSLARGDLLVENKISKNVSVIEYKKSFSPELAEVLLSRS